MQKSELKRYVFLNGKFVPEEETKLQVLAPGFLYGFGLYETMRFCKGRIVYFKEHLERIQDACKITGIRFPYGLRYLRKMIRKAVKLNDLADAYVKLVFWKAVEGTDTVIIARKNTPLPKQKYRRGFCAAISSLRQAEDCFLCRIKSTNRLLYELSFEEAKRRGADEALILNNRGLIAEGSRSNIFFARAGELFTPQLDCGCLEGITRKVVFALAKKSGLRIFEGRFTPRELYCADEAFLTNSLKGIMPLTKVEDKVIGKAKCGKITDLLIKRYNCLLK